METGRLDFTKDQQRAFDVIMGGSDAFITGGAGTGKSEVISAAVKELESQGKNVIVCAPTGTAAARIGGVTIHKAFGFRKGPCIRERTLRLSVRAPKLIRMADVIIIDEISMCRMDMMDAVCASINKAENGKGRRIQFVVSGDFCQLPPVLVEGTGERQLIEEYYGMPVRDAFAFQAPGWMERGFEPAVLDEVVRQGDRDFINALNALRMGDLSALWYLNTHASFGSGSPAMRLYARNRDVDAINEQELAMLPGEQEVFYPMYYGDKSAVTDEKSPVYLKPGARVIVTTNNVEQVPYSKKSQVYNGTTGVVLDMHADELDIERDYVVVGLPDGSSHFIYRQMQEIYTYRIDEDGHIRREIACVISYMPVKLAYAMTVHRSQGQTFDSIELDPSSHTSGQTYVGISRVRSIDGLHLTRRITARDIYLSPVVKEFYSHLGEEDYVPSWERAPIKGVITQPHITSFNVSGFDTPASFRKPVIEFPALELDQAEEKETFLPALPFDPASVLKNKPCVKSEADSTLRIEQAADESSLGETGCIMAEKDEGLLQSAGGLQQVDESEPPTDIPHPKRGRRKRYPSGSEVCRVPMEIVPEVKAMLGLICPKEGMDMDEMQRFRSVIREMCGLDGG